MSHLKNSWSQRTLCVTIRSIFVIFAGLFFITYQPVFAKESSRKPHEPSTSELVGKEVFNERYPNGWMYDRKPDAKKDYEVGKAYYTELKKDQWLAQVYEKVLEVTPVDGAKAKKKRALILDALILERRSYPWIFEKIGTCKFADGSQLKNGFIASVNFERCRRYSTHIEKVWDLDEKSQKFVTMPTKGLTCERIGFGQDPESSECVDWRKCYSHFNIADNKIPNREQHSYCSDNFLYPERRKYSK